MVSSGIPLMDGLSTIEANSSGVVRRLAAAGRSGLEQGLGLSEALATERKLLTPVALALIEAGEQTGDLVAMLDELARIEEEKDNQLRGLLVGLTYPFTVLVLSCVIMPLPELVMSGTRGYLLALGGNLLTLAGAVVALWFALAFAGPALGPLLARLPGHVERFLFPSRAGLFFLVIGACIRTGMSIVQALELAGDVFHSTANRQHLRQAAESVREGQKLADALAWLCRAQDRLLVVAGEQAGTMDRAFADLARMHLQRATRRRRVVTAVASVLLALAVVGWIASSVVSSYQRQVEAPMQELEREMNREMRGIWNNL
jgi:type II secretory pathway component PulF